MINKKQFLGHAPVELGYRDAVHVAIVAVRAGSPVYPGQRCKPNEIGEFIPGDGPGVADPFVSGVIAKGEPFWLLLHPSEVPSVAHTWEHPAPTFAPPKSEVKKNKYLQGYAENFGVTYEQLMAACQSVVETNEPTPYPGSLSEMALKTALGSINMYDIWYEWKDESGHVFENQGSACCPELIHPHCDLFRVN